MKPLDAIRQGLIEDGLLGKNASDYGSPDEVMLVSAGPVSHLSRFSSWVCANKPYLYGLLPFLKNFPRHYRNNICLHKAPSGLRSELRKI